MYIALNELLIDGLEQGGNMICKKCNAEISDESSFCMKCGNLINSATARTENSEDTIKKDTIIIGGKSRKKKTVMRVILIALLCIVVVFSVKYILKKSTIRIAEYIPPQNVEIQYCFVRPGFSTPGACTPIPVIKNNSDKTIKNIKVTYCGFDKNGNQVRVGMNSMAHDINYETVNLMPGLSSGFEIGSYILYNHVSVKYLKAIISKIEYMDGTTWEAKNIDSWVERIGKDFSLEKHLEEINDFETNAKKAEDTEVYVSGLKKKKSGYGSLKPTFVNNGVKTTKVIKALALIYDKNLYAVSALNGSGFIVPNGLHMQLDSVNLQTGYEVEGNYDMIAFDNWDFAKAIVYEIEYTDGSIWQNPYVCEWILYNENMRSE